MTPKMLYALKGGLGGLVFGFASMAVPMFIKPGTRLALPVGLGVTFGMFFLGAFFAKMTWDARPRSPRKK